MGAKNGISDGLIDRWADEAVDDLGKKGWREISPNALMLIIYAAQKSSHKKMAEKITRPLWWVFGAMGTGIAWAIVSWALNNIFGGG